MALKVATSTFLMCETSAITSMEPKVVSTVSLNSVQVIVLDNGSDPFHVSF